MNILKRITVLLLIASLAACVMCGCGGDAQNAGNTENTEASPLYTVTVMDQNDKAVANVILQFTDVNGETQLAVTGENGIVVADSETAMRSVTLSSIPDGYSSDVAVVGFGSETQITIVLQADEVVSSDVTYTVTVVDQNDSPVAGVTVQLCDDEACKLPVVTDENGTVSVTYVESNYHVTLTELPDGYSSEETVFYFENSNEITIVVTSE